MNDELLALAERVSKVPSYTADDFCGVIPILHRYGNSAVDENVTVILICAEFRDHIVTALRLAAQSPEPVTVKPLEWPPRCPRGQRVHNRPALVNYTVAHYGGDVGDAIYRWAEAHSPWSDPLPTYEAAKAAAQADYEQRIRSALVNAPAVDGALREALKDLEAWCDKQGALLGALDGYDYHSGQEAAYRHTAIEIGKRIKSLAASEATKSDGGALPTNLAEIIETELMAWRGINGGIYTIHAAALGISCAVRSAVFRASNTKSDGGMEGHADPSSGRSSRASHLSRELEEAGIKPGPSDLDARLERLQDEATDLGYVLTPEPEHPDSPHRSEARPADVTVDVRALIEFVQSVFDFYNEGHSMPMWIGRDARALLDTYKIGAK